MFCDRAKKDIFLASLLYDAIEFLDLVSIEKYLKEKNANPNLMIPGKGISALHLAVGISPEKFSLKIVEILLNYGANPNLKSIDDHLTPLHIAALYGRTEILNLLIKNGANPRITDRIGKIPLYYAIKENWSECIEILMKYFKEDYLNNISFLVLEKNKKDAVTNKLEDSYLEANNNNNNNSIKEIKSNNNKEILPKSVKMCNVSNWINVNQEKTTTSINTTINNNNTRKSPDQFFYDDREESLNESDGEQEFKRYDSRFITFRKVYRKKIKRKSSSSIQLLSPCASNNADDENSLKLLPKTDDFCINNKIYTPSIKIHSRESGVVTSLNSSAAAAAAAAEDQRLLLLDENSDYFTYSNYSSR